MRIVKLFVKYFPTFLLAFVLAVIVWMLAVTAGDPNEERMYPGAIPIEVVGLDENLILVSMNPTTTTVELSAPSSIWNKLNRNSSLISAKIDLKGLGIGDHYVTTEVYVDISPVRIETISQQTVKLTLDSYLEQPLPIKLEAIGTPATGFELETSSLSEAEVLVKGPSTQVQQVDHVSATLDVDGVSQTFIRTLPLRAFDEEGRMINEVDLEPAEVTVTQPVTQMGGYRNLVVKVVVSGQLAEGYRMSNVSSYPAVVTVFSTNPRLVDDLPGYVETEPLDITGTKNDLDVFLSLSLPMGVSVVGEDLVQVQVGIAAIESSLTLNNMEVELIGVGENLEATVSPEVVDVILSGPLPDLESLRGTDVRVFIDMTDVEEGVYQRVPQVEVLVDGLRVESVLPESIEVVITAEDKALNSNNFLLAAVFMKPSTLKISPAHCL